MLPGVRQAGEARVWLSRAGSTEARVLFEVGWGKSSESIPKRKRTRATLRRKNPGNLAEDRNRSLIEDFQNEFGDCISEDEQKEVKEEFLVGDEKYLVTENIDDLSVSEEYSFADTSIKNQDAIHTSNLSMVHSDLHSNILVENLASNDSDVTFTHKSQKCIYHKGTDISLAKLLIHTQIHLFDISYIYYILDTNV